MEGIVGKGSVLHNLYGLDGLPNGQWLAMPDADIACIAKARESASVWLCGEFVEIIRTSSTFLTGVSPSQEGGPKKALSEDEVSKRCAVRAQKQVRRICNTNDFRYMWTLTMCPANSDYAKNYAEPVCTLTQRHYKSVRCLWGRFIRRIYKHTGKFAWLTIFELHDSKKTSESKRGTYHIHFTTGERLDWAQIGTIWRHGNVRFDDFKKNVKERRGKVRNPGAYLSKYVGKSFDESNRHQKRYSCSQDVKRPLKVSLNYYEEMLVNKRLSPLLIHEAYKEYEFYDEKSGSGGLYGVSQESYRLSDNRQVNV